MSGTTTAWLGALAFLAGYGAAELQHRIAANLRSMVRPRGSYGLPPDHDWRRSFNHENTNAPTGEPPLRLQRSIRLDEGRVQRGNGGTGGYQPKPQITPTGQRRTPNPPPRDPGKPEFPPHP